MTRLQPVRGTRDIFGSEAAAFEHVVTTFREVAKRFQFQPVSTPIFEFTPVFARTMGDSSDVVSKEMYVFEDRGGDSLALRPENTAGIARAFLSNGWQQHSPLRVYADGPMFRYERPQKGRYRQFYQIDAEIIGDPDPAADVELIAMADMLLSQLGVQSNTSLHLNTLADPQTRARYREALTAHFRARFDDLSKDSQIRLEKNPLRILDSKDAGDKEISTGAPIIDDYWSPEAGAFFEKVMSGLDALKISYVRDRQLVRGLDYYSHSVFEFLTGDLGAQNAVLSGGRYDGLMEQLGGPATPGCGWAAGIERLAMLADVPQVSAPLMIAIAMGQAAESHMAGLVHQLRGAGISVDRPTKGNFKKRMKRANAIGATHALILGEDELAAGNIAVKDLGQGEQELVSLSKVIEWARALQGGH
ncbi:MAG: histidine--tRNA ligase [Pseudomonadota bacterium]